MYSSKQNLSSIDDSSDIDNQVNTNNTHNDGDSPIRSYAIIETNSQELDHIIDLIRQFFPATRIIEYNNNNHTLNSLTNVDTSQQQLSIESNSNTLFPTSSKLPFDNDTNSNQVSSNVNSQTFKGKVKDYLQRRYLGQINEHQSRKEIFTNSFDLTPSSTIYKPLITLKSRSLDSQSKRGLLQRCTTIDMDDGSNDAETITSNFNQPVDDDDDDDDDEEEEEEEEDKKEKSHSFSHSYSEQQTKNRNDRFLLPYQHSSEQEQEKKLVSFSNGIPLPLTPYSVSSDPGPFNSPWFNTPTSSFNFRFPQSQEQIVANAQGSIAQLSTLTKMLCDEPSVFTPISPRFKIEKHDSKTSNDSSLVPSCQICRQKFDSRQMYLTHYRTHLENPCENDKSDILDSDINCDRSDDLRNYSCKICSKRFSRSDMLNRHLRLHSGIRPYRCTLCNTYFSRSDHLSTHLRTHTGEKPYTCPQCSYTACRRDMITRHLKIHTKQRSERKNATSTFTSSNGS